MIYSSIPSSREYLLFYYKCQKYCNHSSTLVTWKPISWSHKEGTMQLIISLCLDDDYICKLVESERARLTLDSTIQTSTQVWIFSGLSHHLLSFKGGTLYWHFSVVVRIFFKQLQISTSVSERRTFFNLLMENRRLPPNLDFLEIVFHETNIIFF